MKRISLIIGLLILSAAHYENKTAAETLNQIPAKVGGKERNRLNKKMKKIRKDYSRVCVPTRFDAFFNREDFEMRLKSAGQVSDILEELANSRENFLKTGDFIELFPALYFHTTKGIFNDVLADRYVYPTETMDMMLRFYDSYKMNRELFEQGGADAVEPHWKKYYQKAINGNKLTSKSEKFSQTIDVLISAIEAHLVDLSRLVRYITSNSLVSKSELKVEFDRMDSVFENAAKQAIQDTIKAFAARKSVVPADEMFGLGAAYIISARKNSWNSGVSSQPLPTKKPQPVYKHNPNSRRFFPKEFFERGICRKVTYNGSFTLRETRFVEERNVVRRAEIENYVYKSGILIEFLSMTLPKRFTMKRLSANT